MRIFVYYLSPLRGCVYGKEQHQLGLEERSLKGVLLAQSYKQVWLVTPPGPSFNWSSWESNRWHRLASKGNWQILSQRAHYELWICFFNYELYGTGADAGITNLFFKARLPYACMTVYTMTPPEKWVYITFINSYFIHLSLQIRTFGSAKASSQTSTGRPSPTRRARTTPWAGTATRPWSWPCPNTRTSSTSTTWASIQRRWNAI